MRKLMALVVLLCGAAGAQAAEPEMWCSDIAGSNMAVLVMTDPPVIKSPGKPDEPLVLLPGEEKDLFATITYRDRPITIPVVIYGDRIFGPCVD